MNRYATFEISSRARDAKNRMENRRKIDREFFIPDRINRDQRNVEEREGEEERDKSKEMSLKILYMPYQRLICITRSVVDNFVLDVLKDPK